MNKFAQMLLLEISLDDHYNKYIKPKYPELLYDSYYHIAQIDPTSTNDQRGKYVEWLIKALTPLTKTYKSAGNPYVTMLIKVTQGQPYNIDKDDLNQALGRYDKYPKKEDINKFTNIQDFVIYVRNLPATGKEEKEKDKAIFGDKENIHIIDITEDWIVAQPLTHEGSVKLARYKSPQSAKWCTADPTSDNHCKSYNARGVLVNFLNRKNPLEKVQFFVNINEHQISEVRDFHNQSITKELEKELMTISPRVEEFFKKKMDISGKVYGISEESFHRHYNTTKEFIEKYADQLDEQMKAHIRLAYNQYAIDIITGGHERENNREGLQEFITYNNYQYMNNNYLLPETKDKIQDRFLDYGKFIFTTEYYADEDRYMGIIKQYSVDMGYEGSKILAVMDTWFTGKYRDEIKKLAQEYVDDILIYIKKENAMVYLPTSDVKQPIVKYIDPNWIHEVETYNATVLSSYAQAAIDKVKREDIEAVDNDNWSGTNLSTALIPYPDVKALYRLIDGLDKKSKIDVKSLYMKLLPKGSNYFETETKPYKVGDNSGFDTVINIKVTQSFSALLQQYVYGTFDEYPTAQTHLKAITMPLYKEMVQLMLNNPNVQVLVDEYMTNNFMVVDIVEKKEEYLKIVGEKFKARYEYLNDTKRINSLPNEERTPAIRKMSNDLKGLMTWFKEVNEYFQRKEDE